MSEDQIQPTAEITPEPAQEQPKHARRTRSRKAAAEEGPDVFDQAISDRQAAEAAERARQIVEQTAAAHAMPPENGHTPEHGHAAHHAAHHAPEGNHAEAVGKKEYKPIPDPFVIATDLAAGVKLIESRKFREMVLKFGEGRPEDKPSQEIIDTVKAAGFRWNGQQKVWTTPVRYETAMTTRIDAEALFQEVAGMLREEKGVAQSQGV